MRPAENCRSTTARARRVISALASDRSIMVTIAAASRSGSPGGNRSPVSPCVTSVRLPGMSDAMTGKASKARMVTTIVDDNHHTFEMYSVPPGAKKEMKTMTIEYSRK